MGTGLIENAWRDGENRVCIAGRIIKDEGMFF